MLDATLARAVGAGLLEVETIDLRDFSDNPYRSVDDTPYGGGDGMLIRADILEKALLSIKNDNQLIIYFTPQGGRLDAPNVKVFAESKKEIVLICGRYAGIDERFVEQYVQMEISIGDYVLSGGELPALVFIEAVSRFFPGVLGKISSAEEDSFKNGLLEAPQYTKPQIWNGKPVPEVLLSGNHQKIGEWKSQKAIEVTRKKRPDLLKSKK